jgi:hypothetical protein
MALRGATGKGASGSRPFVSVIGVARGNTIMKKPTKPKTLKKESHKETVARIAAENRAYFQKLESNGKKQSRKADIVAEITAENRRLYFEELESKPENHTTENHTKIRSLFDEYQANNESPSALYVCPHCQNECSVANDLIGRDAQSGSGSASPSATSSASGSGSPSPSRCTTPGRIPNPSTRAEQFGQFNHGDSSRLWALTGRCVCRR